MIQFITASKTDTELLMKSRLECLRDVNDLPLDYAFSEELISKSREYFEHGNQTTILAVDKEVVGCASICYIELMPTSDHPSGKRAHIMNVYTNPMYRRQGIALQMLNMLIEEAREKGVTEISLDATEAGRPLYKRLGFADSEEGMVLRLNKV